MPECRIGSLKIHVEVPLLLLFFAFMLSEAVFTNLMIYRTCYVTLGYNKSECALLGMGTKTNVTKHLEEVVEPYAANINMVRSFIEAFGGAFVCLFVGPWSDKFGRTPVMLMCSICFALKFLIQVVLSFFYNLSPWYFIIACMPSLLSGGVSTFLVVVTTYIFDRSRENNRGIRMAVFESVLTIGILLGNFTSPYLFYATNYAVVFGVSCASCLVAAIFVYFCIPESRTSIEADSPLRELFRISHVKDMYKSTVKLRPNYGRGIILTCVLALSVYITVVTGSGSVLFLFLRDKFQWSLRKFTLYNCLSNIIYSAGSVFGTYVLLKYLKITESVLVLVGYISVLNCALLQGLAQKDWHIYFSTAVHGLSGVISPLSRTMVSKYCDSEETGKVYSFIIISESLFSMMGSPVYTEIYNATITTDPGIFNFVSVGFYFINICLTLWIIWMEVQNSYASPYVPIENKNCNENPRENPVEAQNA